MTVSELPHFQGESATQSGDHVVLKGHFSRAPRLQHGNACLFTETDFIWGDLTSIDEALKAELLCPHTVEEVRFTFADGGVPCISRYYSPRHVWLIAEAEPWLAVTFRESDAYEEVVDGLRGISPVNPDEPARHGARIIPNGWDHEHCMICNAGIGGGDEAYTKQKEWLCAACFRAYGHPRDVSFAD